MLKIILSKIGGIENEKVICVKYFSIRLNKLWRKKVDITPKEEKIKIIQGHLKRDYELREKYYSIQEELQKLADEGNKSAEEELKRWEEIYDDEVTKKAFEVSEETKKM